MQYLICNIKCNIKYKNAYLQHAIFNIINIQRQGQETLIILATEIQFTNKLLD